MALVSPESKFLLTVEFLGYLPAEHIETPTERLARLNKHRNIDVCSGILEAAKITILTMD